jgi:cell division protein FtsI (penicillin-binding protein 3)/stage V sporulation protein D (sporulation-specific penicillin-binding protein)
MRHRQRALVVIVFLCFGFTLVSLRLVQVMLLEHDKWVEFAVANHLRSIELPPHRGLIVDVNGDTLAQTHVLYDISLDCKLVKNRQEELTKVARVLELSPTMLMKEFDPSKGSWTIKKDVTEEVVERLRGLRLKSLVPPQKKFVRGYPHGSHASHILGFLGSEGMGVAGVERLAEEHLRGKPGIRWYERNAKLVEIAAFRRIDAPPADGHTVKLTMDLTIQHAIEEGLDKIVAEHRPLNAYAIVMRPKTGEILAMANRPTFDPNDRATFKNGTSNGCLGDAPEPGSIFKIVALAAGINDGTVEVTTPIFCEHGQFFYGGHVLRDHHPYAVLTSREIMAKSSNIGTVKIALDLGQDRFYQYVRMFGFGSPTRLFPGQGESAGQVRPVNTWERISIARIPIGQGIGVTPLQMANAFCVIANGGKLMEPQIIREITDAKGRVVREFQPKVIRDVLRPEAAAEVTKTLAAVVSKGGTGEAAAIPGFTGAGKTGTAEKAGRGGYEKGKYIASFVGFVPATKPEFVLLVMVDEPNGEKRLYYGGQVAAPAFSEMGQKVAQCLNLVPDVEIPRAEAIQTAQMVLP